MALPLSEIAGELLRTPRAWACDASLRFGEECDACRSFPGRTLVKHERPGQKDPRTPPWPFFNELELKRPLDLALIADRAETDIAPLFPPEPVELRPRLPLRVSSLTEFDNDVRESKFFNRHSHHHVLVELRGFGTATPDLLTDISRQGGSQRSCQSVLVHTLNERGELFGSRSLPDGNGELFIWRDGTFFVCIQRSIGARRHLEPCH
jgi:hypothetical protein